MAGTIMILHSLESFRRLLHGEVTWDRFVEVRTDFTIETIPDEPRRENPPPAPGSDIE